MTAEIIVTKNVLSQSSHVHSFFFFACPFVFKRQKHLKKKTFWSTISDLGLLCFVLLCLRLHLKRDKTEKQTLYINAIAFTDVIQEMGISHTHTHTTPYSFSPTIVDPKVFHRRPWTHTHRYSLSKHGQS